MEQESQSVPAGKNPTPNPLFGKLLPIAIRVLLSKVVAKAAVTKVGKNIVIGG
jgi:hypothetical protein